jgi:hypothetical protein
VRRLSSKISRSCASRKDQLTGKRAKGAAELEMAQSVRQVFLLEGNLDDADNAESLQDRVNNAMKAVDGLNAAIATIDTQIRAADGRFGWRTQRRSPKMPPRSTKFCRCSISCALIAR